MADAKELLIGLESQGLRAVGLEFDSVSTGTRGRIDDPPRRIQILAMIRRHLRNYVGVIGLAPRSGADGVHLLILSDLDP